MDTYLSSSAGQGTEATHSAAKCVHSNGYMTLNAFQETKLNLKVVNFSMRCSLSMYKKLEQEPQFDRKTLGYYKSIFCMNDWECVQPKSQHLCADNFTSSWP